MLAEIIVGKIRKSFSNEIPDEDDFIDAVVLVQTKGIRMVKMVNDESGSKYFVEIVYKDGTTIKLSAHLPDLGEPAVWDQERCAEIIEQLRIR